MTISQTDSSFNINMFFPPPLGVGIFPLIPPTTTTTTTNTTTEDWTFKRCEDIQNNANTNTNNVCEDCGNRAKKECSFRRCRTCCKSRGYDCTTHVKSTWVPAAVRRDKKSTATSSSSSAAAAAAGNGGVKKCKVVNSSGSTDYKTSRGSFYHQDASFREQLPGKIHAPANFKSVRVTALNDGEADIVYQATVNICGHIFKGLLYNHGVDEKNAYPRISELHLDRTGGGKNRDSSSPVVNPPNAFVSGN